jgi:hypothetical protein
MKYKSLRNAYLKFYCPPNIRVQQTYTNYPKHSAADWEGQLIFAGRSWKKNEQQNLAFSFYITTC